MEPTSKIKLILASASPRRQDLIRWLQLPYLVRAAQVDEESITEPEPARNAQQTALLKATAVAAQLQAGGELDPGVDWLIVAADTTVVLDGRMLAKPADEADAGRMLRRLRGRRHDVYTGLVVTRPATGQTMSDAAATAVTMRAYSDAEIAAYIASGDPMDKAGAYAIQHPGFRPVASLDGCYVNVVGLPVCHLACVLAQMGAPLPVARAAVCPPQPAQCPFYPTLLDYA